MGPLGEYYLEWLSDNSVLGEGWDSARLDADGVILSPAGIYHPVYIAQFALHQFGNWIRRRCASARKAFLCQATWFKDNQRIVRGVQGCYPYDFALPDYGAEAGWISAMAQAEAISVLLRAEQEEPKRGFRAAADAAADPFKAELGDGGVVWIGQEDDVFFQEAAVKPPSHVLNGHLISMWGLWELYKTTGAGWLASLLRRAKETLDKRLTLFDSGYWSYYSLLATTGGYRRVAILKYHSVHIAQLKVTSAMFEDPYLEAVADRWEAYTLLPSCRKRVLQNTVMGLFLRYICNARGVLRGERSLLS